MFRAQKYRMQPVMMVRFPVDRQIGLGARQDETHELLRSAKAWRRIERLRQMVGWFGKYSLGKAQGTAALPHADRWAMPVVSARPDKGIPRDPKYDQICRLSMSGGGTPDGESETPARWKPCGDKPPAYYDFG